MVIDIIVLLVKISQLIVQLSFASAFLANVPHFTPTIEIHDQRHPTKKVNTK